MKTQCKKAMWSRNPDKDVGLGLDLSDVNHLQQIYQKYDVVPETFDYVAVEFLTQREFLSRFIIKELDILLMIGGVFEVIIVNSKSHSNYFRSCDQVKYEFSIATNGRYKLLDAHEEKNSGVLKLRYKKFAATLEAGDDISCWSFGIISDGRKNDKVTKLIQSVIKQKIPNFEVIICGPYTIPEEFNGKDIIVLDDVKLDQDIRPPTPAKKNKIIKRARYNNLCVLHDRFTLPHDWYSNFENYGNYFDVLCLPTVDAGGNRFRVDWMNFHYPITQITSQNRSLDYSSWTPEVIIQGGILIAKKNLMQKVMFDERLHWGELEDMQLSKKMYLEGAFINVDVKNFVYSEAVNHKAQSRSETYSSLIERYYWFRGYVSNFIKFRLIQNKYYSKKIKSSNKLDDR
jgi:hypothetical protein